MILKFDKKHRIKTDRWLNISRPQWKGRFFWHDYTVVEPGPSMLAGTGSDGGACGPHVLVTEHAEFYMAADACAFLRIALKQEYDGMPVGTVSNDSPGFPKLKTV